ncbi:MAG: hypothetical protein ED558_16485 [Oricola sp.]|nr:MAG: hypothetical protein ED558_16485 [Oricola sp.]
MTIAQPDHNQSGDIGWVTYLSDNMEPVIRRDSKVTYIAAKGYSGEGYYLAVNDAGLAAYLVQKVGKTMHLRSLNEAYPPMEMAPDDFEAVLFGRVTGVYHQLYRPEAA